MLRIYPQVGEKEGDPWRRLQREKVVAVAGLKGTDAEAEGVYVGTGPIRDNELDKSSCS